MENLVDETVLSTPKPCASSTVHRKEILRKIDKKYGTRSVHSNNICEESETDKSLGIICDVNNKEDLLTKEGCENIKIQLQKQRELAQTTLERSRIALPARFLVPSDTPCSTAKKRASDNSTVNESDLLKYQDVQSRSSIMSGSFIPYDVSTPKSSNITNQVDGQSYYKAITEASEKIRNSDINLKDLCSELSRFSMGKSSIQSGVSNIDSGMFAPGEVMVQKLLDDEQSWRAAKDLPTKCTSISTTNNSQYKEKYSVGDFFKERSEDINNEFFKKSPPKGNPVALVDLTNTSDVAITEDDSRISSIMSHTQIYKILSENEIQDTQQILDYLSHKTSHQKKRPELNATAGSERDVDEFILASKTSNEAEIIGRRNSPCSSVGSIDLREVRNSNLPHITTTSPTVIDFPGKHNENIKYDKFCHNLEVQSSSKLSPNLTQVDKRNSSTVLRNTLNLASQCSRYSNCPTRKIESDLNTGSGLYFPNSLANSPTENKENISDGDRSLTSVRSGSSLDTLPEGKFPIKSNRLELIWGCLKSGRTSTQEFQIRNQLNQRIRMQASLTGSSFRIVKDNHDPEMLTATSFMLRALETKSFCIMFCPTVIGAVSEKLNFYPILGGKVQHSKRQVLTLFGYAGHVSCDIGHVMKDSSGKLWISLGKIYYQTYVEQKFVIKNTGSLHAFACLDIVAKGPFTFSDIKIEPREFILKPLEEVAIVIRYYPSKEELNQLKRVDIAEVGHIKITTGAEATRGRLRRLFLKLKQNDSPVDPLIERLSATFPGENMPSDLKYIKESVSAMRELIMQLSFREVTVTIEQDLESTLVNPIMDMNETSMYHTLHQDDANATGIGDSTFKTGEDAKLFTIEPISIILTLPMKQEDTILLYSKNVQQMPFEIKTEPDNLFEVCPTRGVIGSYETVVIKVSFSQRSPTLGSVLGRVLICVGYEVKEVTVKTVFIKSK